MKFAKQISLSRSGYWAISLLCIVSIASNQAIHDVYAAGIQKATKKAVFENETPLIPSTKALDLFSLNNQPLVADLLWLDTIQYFGSGSPYGNFPALGKQIDTITELDPKFAYPYEFGMVALPFMQQEKVAEKIGLRAQEYIPNNGLLTFYLASIYQLNLKDYKKAGEYYTLASKQPGSPPASVLLAANSYNNVDNSLNDRQIAISYWEAVVQKAHSDEEKERAVAWWKQMQIVYSLEITISQFKDKERRFPSSLQELQEKGYIQSIPESPVRRIFELNSETGKISFTKPVDN